VGHFFFIVWNGFERVISWCLLFLGRNATGKNGVVVVVVAAAVDMERKMTGLCQSSSILFERIVGIPGPFHNNKNFTMYWVCNNGIST
jgi:hypothetical protein